MSAEPARLSFELRSVGERLCRADSGDLPELSQLVLKLAELAFVLELELSILRDMEAGRELRTATVQAIDAQFLPGADQDGKVVRPEFRRRT